MGKNEHFMTGKQMMIKNINVPETSLFCVAQIGQVKGVEYWQNNVNISL